MTYESLKNGPNPILKEITTDRFIAIKDAYYWHIFYPGKRVNRHWFSVSHAGKDDLLHLLMKMD